MSTELLSVTDNILQTRFFGGVDRGTCLQVTQTNQTACTNNPPGIGFILLTRNEAALLATELLRFATSNEVEAHD